MFFFASSQNVNVKELEQELRRSVSGEPLGAKRLALDILAVDRYNRAAIGYILDQYLKTNQKDSIRVYLNNLIRLDPKNAIPYLIKFRFGLSLTKLDKEKLLKEAYSLDSNNITTSYELARLYNEDFHSSLNVCNEKTLNAIASNALFYCTRLYNLNSPYKMVAKFQIIQYLRYLKDNTNYKKYIIKKDDTLFFAWDTYAGLPENWENNFDINVFSIMQNVKGSYNQYSWAWLALME